MFPIPTYFLAGRSAPGQCATPTIIACPGFDAKVWRYDRLAAHMTDWLPEFVFRPEDLPSNIENTTALRKLMERAVHHLYTEDTKTSRGELGELLLHIVCRQFCGTFPAISKLFYKTSSNEFVKGFDIAHVREDKSKNIEIWLGEAKFYQDGPSAVREAVASVNTHLKRGFLKSEKVLLGGKISPETPGYEKLQWIFDQDTPLDEIFSRIVIPILIAYDSDSCSKYLDDPSYDAGLAKEIIKLDGALSNKIKTVDVVAAYVPMNTKTFLQEAFDKRLQGYRS
jgi:hypothetical protein